MSTWKAVFEVLKRLFTINDELNRLQAESKRHGEQILELAASQTRLQYELQLQNERDAREREKEKLQLENRLLRERLDRLERLSLSLKPPDERPKD